MTQVDDQDIEALKELERRNRDAGASDPVGSYVSDESRVEVKREDGLIRRRLGLKREWALLDAGCGQGRYSLGMAGDVARIVAVDFSAASIERLRERAAERSITTIECIASDLCSVELPLASLDAAMSVEVLQHIPGEDERRKAVESIAAGLKPGAPFVMTSIAWNGRAEKPRDGFWGEDERRIWRHHFTPDELKALLEAGGFTDVRTAHFHALPRRILRRLPGWMSWFAAAFDVMARPFGIGTHLVAWGRRR